MQRSLGAGAAAIAIVAFAGACGGSSSGGGNNASAGGSSGGTITWGLIAPFSGSAADYGPPEKAADQAAIDYINNNGGITVGSKTYKMALKSYDSAYDPTTAVTVTRQAVQQDGLKFLEVDGGGIVPAVQPITEPAQAMIFAIAGGDSYLGTKHPLTFRPYYDIPGSSKAILTYFKSSSGNSAPKVDFVEPDDDLGHALANKQAAAAQSLGYQTKIIFLGRQSSDFSPIATKVVADHPDIVDFGPTPGDQYGPFIKSAQQLGYKGVFSFPDTLDTATVAKNVPLKSIAGSLTAPAWSTFPSPAGQFFSASVKKQVGDVQAWTAQAFDNILMFKAAIEKAQSLDPNKIADALSQVQVDGALGKVTYGGASTYGLPRIFEIPYPVDKMDTSGSLTEVSNGSSA
jgi:branched-chain amino acid transport system substrate-binding protein